MKLRTYQALLRLLVAVIACLLAGGTTAFAADLSGAYMAADQGGLIYCRTTQSANAITGYLQTITPVDKPDDCVKVTHIDFTGSVSASSINLKINQGFGFYTSIQGTVKGHTIALEFTGTDGKITKVTLAPVSTEKWNSTLGAFQLHWKQTYQDTGFQKVITAYYTSLCSHDQRFQYELDESKAKSVKLTSLLKVKSAGLADLKRKLVEVEAADVEAQKAYDEADKTAQSTGAQVDNDKMLRASTRLTQANSDKITWELRVQTADQEVGSLLDEQRQTEAAIKTNTSACQAISKRVDLIATPKVLATSKADGDFPIARVLVTRTTDVLAAPDRSAKKILTVGPPATCLVMLSGADWLIVSMKDGTIAWIDRTALRLPAK